MRSPDLAEKGIDAIHIDDRAKLVTIVQGKYRQSVMASAEGRDHVLGFAGLAETVAASRRDYEAFAEGLEGNAFTKMKEARERVLSRSYRLNLHYATLGRCSPGLLDEAKRLVRSVEIPAVQRPRFTLLNGKQIMAVLADYLDGVAPPVSSIELALDGKPQEQYDRTTSVSSWIFSVSGWEIGQLVEQFGVKLFARNIRGYLGETTINQEIRKTLRRDPESFWYLNNGVTIVCDEAMLESSSGRDRLTLRNPQIINGQQTSYALSAEPRGAHRAQVSVRVISVATDGRADDYATYEQMVSRIVEATNSQNRIKASDLRANDRLQVALERDLHQLGYHYQRKRMAQSEVAAVARQHEWRLTKEGLAKAVVGCEDAVLVRRGVDVLFEEPHYKRIFRRSPRQLLTRWWLSKAVDWGAWGDNERGWAKYVVLRFLWEDLGPDIRRREARFIEMFENWNNDPGVPDLRRTVNHAFKGATAFYRAERGKGRDRIELSPFFKRQDVSDRFARFWRSNRNVHRSRYTNARKRFIARLEER
jgi:hypothetical protein